MGAACSTFFSRIKPSEIPERTNDVHRPNYEKAPVVLHQNLLHDATGNVPRARQMHTLVKVDEQTLLCYGGFCANIDTNDLTLDALPRDSAGLLAHPTLYHVRDNRWSTFFVPKGAEPITSRALHSSVVYHGGMYVFGVHHKKDNAVHRLDLVTGAWTVCLPRETDHVAAETDCLIGHSAVVVSDSMLVFGGETAKGVSNRLLSFCLKRHRWSRIAYSLQSKDIAGELSRRDHTAVLFKQFLFVYGGASSYCDTLGLLKFDAATKEWSAPPSARRSSKSVPVSAEGGAHSNPASKYQDISSLALDHQTVSSAARSPPYRRGHACQIHDNYMLVFGGSYRSKLMNDLWIYDVYADYWREVTFTDPQPPPPRRAFSGNCICGAFWYIHGGGNERCLFRSLLRLDVNEIVRFVDLSFTPPDSRWTEATLIAWHRKRCTDKINALRVKDNSVAVAYCEGLMDQCGSLTNNEVDGIWHGCLQSLVEKCE